MRNDAVPVDPLTVNISSRFRYQSVHQSSALLRTTSAAREISFCINHIRKHALSLRWYFSYQSSRQRKTCAVDADISWFTSHHHQVRYMLLIQLTIVLSAISVNMNTNRHIKYLLLYQLLSYSSNETSVIQILLAMSVIIVIVTWNNGCLTDNSWCNSHYLHRHMKQELPAR
jgi:hypothetical protein